MSKGRDEFISELAALIKELIPDIPEGDNDRIDEPSIELTIGANEEGWAYQTGDTQFFGDAYSFSNWGKTFIYRDSDPAEKAREVVEDLEANNDAERYFYDPEEERDDPDANFGK